MDKQKIVLCDVDGTVALANNRSFYDYTKASNDLPIEHTIKILQGLDTQGYLIIFMTGRDSCSYLETYKWIKKHILLSKFSLITRKAKDKRRDDIIKKELYEEEIKNNYDVLCVFEDRPRVIRMWIEEGLNVLSVGNPYLEF